MVYYPDDQPNGTSGVSGQATPRGASRTDLSSILPPGISLNVRAPPVSYQPANGGRAPPRTSGYGPAAGRSRPTASGRTTPDSEFSYEPRRRPGRAPKEPSNYEAASERSISPPSRRPSAALDRPSGAAGLPGRSNASAFLPPGVSLNARATPPAYQPSTGRNTPHSYVPASGRSTPASAYFPQSGRTTPTSLRNNNHEAPRSRSVSRTELDSKPTIQPPLKKPPRVNPPSPLPSKPPSQPPSQPPSRRTSASASVKADFERDGDNEEKEFEGDENEERGNWSNKMDFILSCLGYAVGLGNVWRFPYLAYRNGGGAFLIPYTIMLFFAGLPLFLLEVSFGQYCSLGPISIWRCAPLFRGIGYCQMFTAFIQGVYYNVIIMYTIYYFFASFTSNLPWAGCQNSWNNVYCLDLYNDCVENQGIIATNGSCLPLDSLNDTVLEMYNVTSNLGGYNITGYNDPLSDKREFASEQYWKNAVLQEADTMNEPGGVIWQLALCLLVAWIIVLLCLVRGIKSSGKVVYFTATFPYIVLFILLIRGATLPGAGNGIRFFIIPDFNRLSDAKVWQDAAIQIFYSLSAAGGGLVTLASYNKFHNNAYWDSMFVAISNCCTSVFAGFVIFSIVGFMAHELGQPVETVVEQGFGLAFIAYPAAVARMPVSPLWAILFFSMLITLGLDSQFAIMENLVTAIVDEFTFLRKKKTYVLLVACAVMYISGFSCITHTGSYWVSHLDSYGAFFNYIVYALLECVALGWVYGVKRLHNDLRTMIQTKWIGHWSFMWWPMNWAAFTPALMLFVLLFNWFNWQEPSYNGPFPEWARAIGWMITTMSLIWIPVVIIYEFLMEEGTFMERWHMISNPMDVWGPALPRFRLEAWKVHHRHGTTMGGRLDIDGSGRKWKPGVVKLDEEEEEERPKEVILDRPEDGELPL